MAENLTDAELTLMGLLAERPRHGYDLDRVIAQRGMREWTSIGFSSIYYLLDKLERRGLIARVAPKGTPRRAIYALTTSGRRRFAAESLAALTTVTPPRPRVLVGIAGQGDLAAPKVRARLEERRRRLRDDLAMLRRTARGQEPLPPQGRALFAYGEAMIRADLRWTERLLADRREESVMEKYDVKKAKRDLYAPPGDRFMLVDVPDTGCIAIDGHGDPNTSADYAAALEALYAVAYAIKFASKRVDGRDFVVAPLEGLWRSDDPAVFATGEKDRWDWTMLIVMPEWIGAPDVTAAVTAVAAKKALGALPAVTYRTLAEGRCVQIMHTGSYDDEAPVLARLHREYLPANGLAFNGDHHEIYLSDPRRTPPQRRKTILRQPVRPA